MRILRAVVRAARERALITHNGRHNAYNFQGDDIA